MEPQKAPEQIGNESREQIIPSNPTLYANLKPPKYDFPAHLKFPHEVNVRRDDTLGSVVDAAKGVMYYSDMIGFGQSSGGLTAGLPFQKLGINYFMPSGLKCSNGADMWTYFQGIPKGDALGKRFQGAIEGMGYPPMQGLAPGILEDTKAAMNTAPILQAAFGDVYPVCVKARLPVGDANGYTYDTRNTDDDGNRIDWIKGDVQYINGVPTQERWIQKKNAKGDPIFISKQEWLATPKTEGFQVENDGRKESLLISIILFSIAWGIACGRK